MIFLLRRSTELPHPGPSPARGEGRNTRSMAAMRHSNFSHLHVTNAPPAVRLRSQQAARRGLRRLSQNRRKSCALNPRIAHKWGAVVRVGALTNKAAHYRFELVRTGQGVLRALTSIWGSAAGSICRLRRGLIGGVAADVRMAAHIAERHRGRSLQNAGAQYGRSKLSRIFMTRRTINVGAAATKSASTAQSYTSQRRTACSRPASGARVGMNSWPT